MQKHAQKGFTLIELLVVIAIIAILSVVVILTLNPAELIRQARDSNRISDLNTIKSAISLFLADTASSTIGDYTKCYVDTITTNSTTTCGGTGTSGTTVGSSATPRAVDSTGWIPIRFTAISSGAPFGSLPIEPLDNDKSHFYAYHNSSSTASTFKLTVQMESIKYKAGGPNDIVGTDGGYSATVYEVGTDLNL